MLLVTIRELEAIRVPYLLKDLVRALVLIA